MKKKASNKNANSISFDKMILDGRSPFAIKEAYKMLRSNISFALPDEGPKVIGVTSANRSEGKSSTSLNAAISFASLGLRVIVLDCDMRIPSIAAKLQLKGSPGLSDYLINACPMEEAIRYPDNCGGLHIIPAGHLPADPTGLLSSRKFVALLDQLKTQYDYIFLDFPPINTVTDAVILAKQVDGYLLVIRHNVTEYRQAALMKRNMLLGNANLLGIVYNDAPIGKKSKYGSYHYSYSYGYYA